MIYRESLLVIANEFTREGEETTLANYQVEAVIGQIDVYIFRRPNYIESSEPATKGYQALGAKIYGH